MKRLLPAMLVLCCLSLMPASAISDDAKKLAADLSKIGRLTIDHRVLTYICIDVCRKEYCDGYDSLSDCAVEMNKLLNVKAPTGSLSEETEKDPIKLPRPFILDLDKPSPAHALGFFLCLQSCSPDH